MQITWTTASGKAVELELVTSEESIIDNGRVACRKLECRVPALGRTLSDPRLIAHPVAGLALSNGLGDSIIVPVASEVSDQVRAMVDGFHAETAARIKASFAAQAAYLAGHDAIRNAMDTEPR